LDFASLGGNPLQLRLVARGIEANAQAGVLPPEEVIELEAD
jgi:hypothetical protein